SLVARAADVVVRRSADCPPSERAAGVDARTNAIETNARVVPQLATGGIEAVHLLALRVDVDRSVDGTLEHATDAWAAVRGARVVGVRQGLSIGADSHPGAARAGRAHVTVAAQSEDTPVCIYALAKGPVECVAAETSLRVSTERAALKAARGGVV